VSYYDRPEGLQRALCPFCGARLRIWDWDPNDSTEAEEPPLRRPVYWRVTSVVVDDVERTFCLGCYITRKYAAGVDDEDSEAIQRRL
jgi:hypothetical protein